MDITDILNFEEDKAKTEENKEKSEEKTKDDDKNSDNSPKITYAFGEEFNKAYGDHKSDDFQK